MKIKRLTTKLAFPAVSFFCWILLSLTVAVSLSAGSEAPVPINQSAAYSFNPAIVRKVQIVLRNRGYYAADLNGYLGQATGNAIQRFQIDHRQKVIPLVDRTLLVSLGITSE